MTCRGVGGQGARHLRAGGAVRRRHRRDRPARHVRARDELPRRHGDRVGRDGRGHRVRGGHPAAGPARLPRDARAEPPREAAPCRGRRGRRSGRAGGVWQRWAGVVQRRPKALSAVAIVLIGVLAVPVFSLRLGSSDAGNDPSSTTTRQAYDLLADRFRAGLQRAAPARRRDAHGGGPAGVGPAGPGRRAAARAWRGSRRCRCRAGSKIGVVQVIPTTLAAVEADLRPDQHGCAMTSCPRPSRGTTPDGVRRRSDRDLRRLRRRADRQAAAVPRRDHRAWASCCC